jgi:hypothetical protein
MKKVYYALGNPGLVEGSKYIDNDIVAGYVTNLHKDLKKQYKGNEMMEAYLSCPASTSVLNNTYAIRSGITFSMEFTNRPSFKVEITNKTLEDRKKDFDLDSHKFKLHNFTKQSFVIRDFNTKFVSYTDSIWLFCEEDLRCDQNHPHFDNTDLSKYTQTTIGGFNISKWFRPIQPTFILLKDKIEVKQGDALAYISFPPGEKIRLIPFKMTSKILQYSKQCVNYKFWEKRRTMNFLYNVFKRNMLDKMIIKEIKKNIIE